SFSSAILTLPLLGCMSSGGFSGDDAEADADADADADGSMDAGGDADSDADADGGGGPVDCPDLVVPSGAVGLASTIPTGSGEGDFALSFWVELDAVNGGDLDAAKTIPLASDLDGDGDLDLAMNPRKMSSAVVFEGLGDGTFVTSPHFLPGSFATGWGIDLADLDGSGVDVVVGDHGSGAHTWRNGGGLQFSASDSGLPPGTFSGAGVADLSGDGAFDAIFGADQFGDGFAVAFGTGSGGFATESVSGLPPLGSGSEVRNVGYFAFGDIDADSDLDVFAFGMGLTAFVYANGGDGRNWSEAARVRQGVGTTIGNPVQGSVGDVNGDDVLDVAVGGLVSTGSGGSFSGGTTVDGALISHLADMNGDCALDLITHSVEGGLALHIGDGSGGFTASEAGLPGAGDFPADMTPNSSGATFSLSTTYGIEIGDLDGNGALDIVRAYLVQEEGGACGGFGGMTDTSKRNVVEVWIR
ncbi:MAG: VCBS repeat-containing protein, partial [Actinobacteria bacterium]|nr:VCBS repeat-containing protein [Actinomycetota bacterium]